MIGTQEGDDAHGEGEGKYDEPFECTLSPAKVVCVVESLSPPLYGRLQDDHYVRVKKGFNRWLVYVFAYVVAHN